MKPVASSSVGRRSLSRGRAVATAVAFAIVASGGAALAADPPGSVTLASGLSSIPSSFQALAHTSRGTIIKLNASDALQLVSDTGTSTAFPFPTDLWGMDACGDVASAPGDLGSGVTVHWRNVATGTSGSRALSTDRIYVGSTAAGWLESEGATVAGTATTVLHAITASTGADTVLASFPADDSGGAPYVSDSTCDAAGVAIVLDRGSSSSVVVLANGGTQSVVTNFPYPVGGSGYIKLFGKVGTTVAYETGTFEAVGEGAANSYRKAPGVAAETIAADPTSVRHLAISASETFFAASAAGTGALTYYRKPVGQPAVPVSGIPTGPGLIAPAGAGFIVAGSEREGSGIYTVAGTTVKRVWTPPFPGLSAESVIAAPGRAVWSDDRRVDEPLWSRSVTGTTALTAGAESLIGTRVSGGLFSVNGRRTVWTNRDTGKLVVQDGATSQLRTDLGLARGMSGHRVLSYQLSTTGGRTSVLTNLVTGASKVAPSITAIWGNTGVGFDTADNIVKQDLVTGARSVEVPAATNGIPSGGWAEEPILEGDLLAWISRDSDSTRVNWRNIRTGVQSSRTITTTGTDLSRLSLQGTVLVASQWVEGPERGTTQYNAYAIDTATGAVSTPVSGAGWGTVDAGPSGLGWAAVNGQPKLSPLAGQRLRPRHEGNPFAPTTFTSTSGAAEPWVGEWVFTEQLTTCSVQLRNSAGTLVRTLTCNATYAKQGEAVVSWDGKDAAGTGVPSGTYTWTVVAGDADGTVVDTDGLSTSIKGNITVTGEAPAGKYVALTPARLVDTRTGLGAPKSPVGAGKEIVVQVVGQGGVPTSNVSSVVLNVTAVSPAASGYATIYPSGTSRPTASNINYAKGATLANQVFVKVGSDGKARLFTSATTNLIVDVAGYYPPGPQYTGLAPARLLDTRTGLGAAKIRIPAGGTVDLQVAGRGGVPATGAASAAINITAVNPSAGGYVTAWPTESARPNASNVNYAKAQTIAGLAVVKLGTGGRITLFSSASTDLLVDVAGWFPTSSDFQGATPARILDTRVGTGAPKSPIAAGGTYSLQVAGVGGVPATGVKAVLVNVTVVGPTGPGFVTAYPSTVSRPTASNVNYLTGQTIANTVLAKLGTDGKIKLYTSANTHLITDVQGYITN
ncbi:FlgD immunoglobulin-like domain containing protein [Rothia sp. ARF10]|nr:FlgD immunoglobulin-like domain containing protein [Rothia sp. ARF10]